MRKMMINQRKCKLALLSCIMATVILQHQASALAMHKQKLITSKLAFKKQRYQALDDQSALEWNEISPSFSPQPHHASPMFAPHGNYENNDQSQPEQGHKLIENSIGDEQPSAASAIDSRKSKISGDAHQSAHLQDCLKTMDTLQRQFVEQVIKQRVVDADHLLMEKWLVDNVNDLHRELKQTEMDFEHYVQVTKKMMARNDLERDNYLLKRELAMKTALPLSFPLRTVPVDRQHRPTAVHNHNHRQHLKKLLMGEH